MDEAAMAVGGMMDYYVQFDKQGPADAESAEEAQKKASEALIAAVKKASDEANPVEALISAGFSVRVSQR